VRTDHHVGTDLDGGVGGVGGLHPQALTQRDRRLVGHPRELATTNHGDLGVLPYLAVGTPSARWGRRSTRHGNHGVMAAERAVYRR